MTEAMDENVLTLEDFAGLGKKKPPKKKEDFCRGVVEYSMEGEYLNDYVSLSDAAKQVHLSPSTIGNICAGRHLYSKRTNRIFLFRGDDIENRLQRIDKLTTGTPKTICEYTLGGKFLCMYPNSVMAAKINNTSPYLISNCCKGRRLFVDKRIFLYNNDDVKERVKKVKKELYRLSQKRPKYKPVDAYTIDGKFIKAYPSASAASREFNIHVSEITRCCHGISSFGKNKLTVKGMIFLWVGESISERLELIKLKH